MFKTLGCLVVAMSSASALLSWMDPSVDFPAESLSTSQILSQTDYLVHDHVDIIAERWTHIEIISGQPIASSGRWLSASADMDQPHFTIDQDGKASCGVRWRNQTAAFDQPSTLRIRVSSLGEGQPMNAIQWTALRALVSTLNRTLAEPEYALPVYLEDTWSDIYDLQQDTAVQIEPL